jgi:hypothetical protein
VFQNGGERNINPRPSYIRDVKHTTETRVKTFGRDGMNGKERVVIGYKKNTKLTLTLRMMSSVRGPTW